MVGISSTDLNAGLNVGSLNTEQTLTKQDERMEFMRPQGDTVEISDEARALLQEKLDEYGVEKPHELTSEQQQDLRSTMEAEFGAPPNGVRPPEGDPQSEEAQALFQSKLEEYGVESPDELTDAQKQELRETMDAEFGPPPQAGGAQEMRGTSQAGASGGNKQMKKGGGEAQATSDDDDEIEDIEDDIDALETEIDELRAKAANDEEAKEELKTKQTELMLLEAELALLQESETA